MKIGEKLAKRAQHIPDNCGFVFAATGEKYTTLARRSAKNLRSVMPNAQIDLFTDQEVSDDVFEHVHLLDHKRHRPKMECLRRSRFEKTIYLDADTMVVAPIGDVFHLLDKYEFVAAQVRIANNPMTYNKVTHHIPPSFPMVNSGVIGLRRNANTAKLLTKWENAWGSSSAFPDQPFLRKILFEDDIKLGILPLEYNLINHRYLKHKPPFELGARIIHSPRLHKVPNPGDPNAPFRLEEALSGDLVPFVQRSIDADISLGGNHPEKSDPSQKPRQKHNFARKMKSRLLALTGNS